jgi:hypothetical protein
MEVFCYLQTNTNFLLYKTPPRRDFLFTANNCRNFILQFVSLTFIVIFPYSTKKPRVEMGTVLILNRGLGKPNKLISTATHVHSWRGRFYLYSSLSEMFQVSIEM